MEPGAAPYPVVGGRTVLLMMIGGGSTAAMYPCIETAMGRQRIKGICSGNYAAAPGLKGI